MLNGKLLPPTKIPISLLYRKTYYTYSVLSSQEPLSYHTFSLSRYDIMYILIKHFLKKKIRISWTTMPYYSILLSKSILSKFPQNLLTFQKFAHILASNCYSFQKHDQVFIFISIHPTVYIPPGKLCTLPHDPFQLFIALSFLVDAQEHLHQQLSLKNAWLWNLNYASLTLQVNFLSLFQFCILRLPFYSLKNFLWWYLLSYLYYNTYMLHTD